MKTICVCTVQEVYCHTEMEVTDEQYEELMRLDKDDSTSDDDWVDALVQAGIDDYEMDIDEFGSIVRASIVDWDNEEEAA